MMTAIALRADRHCHMGPCDGLVGRSLIRVYGGGAALVHEEKVRERRMLLGEGGCLTVTGICKRRKLLLGLPPFALRKWGLVERQERKNPRKRTMAFGECRL